MIFIEEVKGKGEAADEPRVTTGRMWIATEDFVWEHFQPEDTVIEILQCGRVHLTREIIDELGIGSEPCVKVLV